MLNGNDLALTQCWLNVRPASCNIKTALVQRLAFVMERISGYTPCNNSEKKSLNLDNHPFNFVRTSCGMTAKWRKYYVRDPLASLIQRQRWIEWRLSVDDDHQQNRLVNEMCSPCPAEVFQLYFSSFEAGIANAISSFK